MILPPQIALHGAPNIGQREAGVEETRSAISTAYRLPEPVCVPPLIEAARIDPPMSAEITSLARDLVTKLRSERQQTFGVEALMKEFSLSSREGVALMCLAESLLRIPDRQTRDLLIRDKLSRGDWRSHLGASPSWFVNASTWGLLITGKLVATNSEHGMVASLSRAVARGGEPIIRKAMDLAMRLLGRQFVTGQTIEEALDHARPFEARGFLYSFDMLGEAAINEEDASRYMASYEHAIEAIGGANRGKGVYYGAGISVKLSALHPRYSFTQMDRVGGELYPRLRKLAMLAHHYDIGFNIDAEEADRLEPSLDLLEALAGDSALGDWRGLGFVVQAYHKRAPFVIDHLLSLAARTKRRLMIRLVKGAYWDSEIKRAQVDGLSGYPVYTRKAYTDVSYLACAKRLLARRDLVFPQFATHNAHTLSAIYYLAGPKFQIGDYEFQCLHGMGETLYGHVVGAANLNRPCRIYAPVGSHETLLAYLVRRLLENGANSSFVHQLVDEAIAIEDLIADPIEEASRFAGEPHPMIALPGDMFGAARKNSKGMDLSDASARYRIERAIAESHPADYAAGPILASLPREVMAWEPIRSPANRADIVGHAVSASMKDIESALASAACGAANWAHTSAGVRAAILDRGADLLEQSMERLCALLVREAGKTMPDAIGEVREAVDFCRYYASQVRVGFGAAHIPLGPTVCISPWNFPLAIFTGQIAAALAAGNPVLAKPAEQTPLIAAEAIRTLHEAGVPRQVLQFLPGDGSTVGAALVADPRTKGVLFTGSTEVARSIQRALSQRGNIPLIAETGGQNAMIVDSSALPEQVVGDVLTSAFDSAGQRCSALRVLCLQEDIADRVISTLKGAMEELRVGDPSHLETDVGPVIDAEAQASLASYLSSRRERILFQTQLPPSCSTGTFVPPTLLEIGSISELTREIFGPILHVVRFARSGLTRLIEDINATGYGLTLGIHSRIDETIDSIIPQTHAGNIYVNRNMIGAVVGVQPFGGEGLSGTGPKAGGPLYVHRLLRDGPPVELSGGRDEAKLEAFASQSTWIEAGAGGLISDEERTGLSKFFELYGKTSLIPVEMVLPGPVGEDNRLRFVPRGDVLGIAETMFDVLHQFGAALATGNRLLLVADAGLEATDDRGSRPPHPSLLPKGRRDAGAPSPDDDRPCSPIGDGAAPSPLGEGAGVRGDYPPPLAANVARLISLIPESLRAHITFVSDWETASFDAVMISDEAKVEEILQVLAMRPGPIVPVVCANPAFSLQRLVKERSVSVNTAAAGGNASLMTIGK